MTNDDTKAPDRRALLDALRKQIDCLRDAWTLWRRLFYAEDVYGETDVLRVQRGDRAYRVTGGTSVPVFEQLRWQVLRGVLIDICRLLDRPSNGSKRNLSLGYVANELDPPSASGQRGSLSQRAKRARRAAMEAGLFRVRHKLLAHCDLHAALGDWKPPQFKVSGVERTLRSIVWFLDTAEQGDDAPLPPLDACISSQMRVEADQLLDVLERGLER